MSLSLPSGRSRPLSVKNRLSSGAAALALAAGLAGLSVTTAARADIWGYIDESGRSHLASEKLDDRYTLFFKGGVRVDTSAATTPASAASAAASAAAASASAAAAALASAEQIAAQSRAVPKQLPASVAHFEPLINQYAKMHNVDPALVKAVIAVESAFQPGVVSAKGAMGLMQIIPDTGERYGVTGDRKQSIAQKLFDPATNLKVGTRYLRDLLGMFKHNVELALAAYNAGEGNVMKYKNTVPPFAETREYVKKVQKLYADYKPVAPVVPAQAAVNVGSGFKQARFVLPGQRVSNSSLVPIAADMATSLMPSAVPAVTTEPRS